MLINQLARYVRTTIAVQFFNGIPIQPDPTPAVFSALDVTVNLATAGELAFRKTKFRAVPGPTLSSYSFKVPLRYQVADHLAMNIGQAKVSTLETKSQSFMIDPQKV